MNTNFPQALTYDDVLLRPKYSAIASRKSVDTSSYLTQDIKLHIPVVSSNMDSVTESRMAIAMAKLGGIGIIHRFLSIEDQVAEVKKVKRNENLKIDNPITILVDKKVKDALELMQANGISGLLVVDSRHKLKGILTNRDLHFVTNSDKSIKDVMTREVVTSSPYISIKKAVQILDKHKIEKLPLVDKDNLVKGLITRADIMKKKLKKVDKKKNPGLAKLPTKVRNKMGFMKKGGKVK